MMETNKPFFLIGEITVRKYINGNNGIAIRKVLVLAVCKVGLVNIKSISNF